MQAALRSVFPELARGISTFLALRAQTCPDCTCSPTVHVEPSRCADCVCEGNQRRCTDGLGSGDLAQAACLGLLLGVIVDGYLGVLLTRRLLDHCDKFAPSLVEHQEALVNVGKVSAAAKALSRRSR